MKRLLLPLPLIFGLAYPASGQPTFDPYPNAPLGHPGACGRFVEIMVHSQHTLFFLTNEMMEQSYYLRGNDEEVRANKLLMLSGENAFIYNINIWIQTATHAHEMARAAYESACVEDDK